MRIWSLLPSATEILFALGLGDEVTGVTHECDYPPQVQGKPRVTRSFIDSSRPSRDIDQQVGERLRLGQQIYAIDEAQLGANPPDLIVTQDLCPVCAVSPSDFSGHIEATGCQARVLCLNPTSLEGILQDIRQIGEASRRLPEAEALVASLQARIDAVATAVADVQGRPRVLCLEWLDPPLPAGHWLPQMVALAGGQDSGLIAPGTPSRKLAWQEMRAVQPEVIVLMPCGFPAQRAVQESMALLPLDDWLGLPAVRQGRVFAVDANAYFSRPGPRLVDGLEILARILHPDRWTLEASAAHILKQVPPPAGASSVENWQPRFEPYF